MAKEPKHAISIYLSYAQKDEALKQEFEDYLAILQQTQLISGWVERQVQPGTDWSQVIDPRIFLADLFVLLVSPSLLASGYCSGAEIREAFERNKTPRKAVLIPILLYYVNLIGYPLGSIRCIYHKPDLSGPERHETWSRIDQEMREVIKLYSSGHYV